MEDKLEYKNKIYHLIDLKLRGQLNDQQRADLGFWLNESHDNNMEYQEVVKIIQYSQRLGSMKAVNTSDDLTELKLKISNRGRGRNFILGFQRVAAILIIPLLLYTAFSVYNASSASQDSKVFKSTETSYGIRSQIQLEDGTKVWLNSGSKLMYPEKFPGKRREVTLVGEAYFQVQSDKKHPFYVDIGGLKIKATGTNFNISNYQDDNVITTYLESGKVSLVEYKNGYEIQHGKLDAGQKIQVNKKLKKYSVSDAEGEKYLAWIDDKLVFRKDDMLEVARKLGHWFNADIEIQDIELYEYVFTATFESESLEEALRLLSYSSPIDYQIIDNYQLDDSSFSKRKVIIKKLKENMN